MSRCKHYSSAAKGPRPQVPACLKKSSEFIEIIKEQGGKHLNDGVAVGRKQKAVKVTKKEKQ